MADLEPPLEKAFIPKSATELLEYAHTVTVNTHNDFQRAAFLYYIARIMVALYEAVAHALPIQVWNEYRNALDHFMRYIASPGETTKDHLEKMENHVQRAVLDVCKYFYYALAEQFEQRIKRDGADCLRLVDNGDFFRSIVQLNASAEKKFLAAKTSDNQLGKYFTKNDEVILRYLEPCFLHLEIQSLFQENIDKIENAAQQMLSIKSNTENEVRKVESRKLHVKSHVVGHAVWAVIAVTLYALWQHLLSPKVLPFIGELMNKLPFVSH